ncbi:MAG: IS66 family transposase [Candidatus Accumulibacter similis]|nr:MAG: IS66 family transposase [Candidatus Accumulibacter similis]
MPRGGDPVHQRLSDAGFTVSRPWLTQIAQQGSALLEAIHEAQLASIRESRVKAMDETPIKAGHGGPGKLKRGYFWPVHGERDEICFPFFESREIKHVEAALGLTPAERAVLLSDGYHAYAHYAAKTGITHAQCWTHTRRGFFEAQAAEPEAGAEALALIGELYQVEEDIRQAGLSGERKKDHRLAHARPVVERFFAWIDERFAAQGLLPSNPLTKALAYARDRRFGLEVFLTDPDVPIDTNHLERALRVIPMGRRNWMFCWTELGARHVGILQSLIVTCRLHDINPYDYLVDVLQRVGQHPADRVHELTPRCWKDLFAANPLRSPLHRQAPWAGRMPQGYGQGAATRQATQHVNGVLPHLLDHDGGRFQSPAGRQRPALGLTEDVENHALAFTRPAEAVSHPMALRPDRPQVEFRGKQLEGRVEVGQIVRHTSHLLPVMLDQLRQLRAFGDQGHNDVVLCHEKCSRSVKTKAFSWSRRSGAGGGCSIMPQLTTLAPDIVPGILDGRLPHHLIVHELAISPPVR